MSYAVVLQETWAQMTGYIANVRWSEELYTIITGPCWIVFLSESMDKFLARTI